MAKKTATKKRKHLKNAKPLKSTKSLLVLDSVFIGPAQRQQL